MKRRDFLKRAAAWSMAMAAPWSFAASQESGGGRRLRTITYNVLACKGYPQRSANRDELAAAQPRMAAAFAAELARYEPDIVTFQEGPHEVTLGSIATAMGMTYVPFNGGWEGNDTYPFGFPGAVITKLRFLEWENCPLNGRDRPADLFTRHWGRARLEFGDREIAVYSAHLHPSDASIREREVTEILSVLEAEKDSGRLVLFQGDLNHTPDGPEYARWVGAGLVDALAAKGAPGQMTFPSTKPNRQIDYIWALGELAERLTSCRVLYEHAFRTVASDDTSFALSDHVPVLAEFTW